MLVFKIGEAKNFIVTLSESKTVAEPIYVFNFRHVTLKDVVTVTYQFTDDLSEYPNRYNEFVMASTTFTNATKGQYTYEVIEQQTNNILEVGKMLLQPANEITHNGYNEATQRKGYRD